jgi:hypothetical protein
VRLALQRLMQFLGIPFSVEDGVIDVLLGHVKVLKNPKSGDADVSLAEAALMVLLSDVLHILGDDESTHCETMSWIILHLSAKVAHQVDLATGGVVTALLDGLQMSQVSSRIRSSSIRALQNLASHPANASHMLTSTVVSTLARLSDTAKGSLLAEESYEDAVRQASAATGALYHLENHAMECCDFEGLALLLRWSSIQGRVHVARALQPIIAKASHQADILDTCIPSALVDLLQCGDIASGAFQAAVPCIRTLAQTGQGRSKMGATVVDAIIKCLDEFAQCNADVDSTATEAAMHTWVFMAEDTNLIPSASELTESGAAVLRHVLKIGGRGAWEMVCMLLAHFSHKVELLTFFDSHLLVPPLVQVFAKGAHKFAQVCALELLCLCSRPGRLHPQAIEQAIMWPRPQTPGAPILPRPLTPIIAGRQSRPGTPGQRPLTPGMFGGRPVSLDPEMYGKTASPNIRILVAEGVIPPLALFLSEASTSDTAPAAALISHMGLDAQAISQIQPAIKFLMKHAQSCNDEDDMVSPKLCTKLVRAIATLSEEASNLAEIERRGGVDLVKLLIARAPRSSKLQLQTLRLIISLAKSTTAQVPVAAVCLPCLVDLIRQGSTEERALAASALGNLTIAPENKLSVASAGGVGVLLSMLEIVDQPGKEDALRALGNIAVDQSNHVLFAAADVLELLVQQLCTGTSGTYASPAVRIAFATVAESWLDEAGTKYGVAGTLRNLAASSVFQKRIIDAGALRPLLELLETGPPKCKEVAAGCVRNVAVLPENKELLAAVGVMPMLLELLKTGIPPAREAAARAIVSLTISVKNREMLLISKGDISLQRLLASGDSDLNPATKELIQKIIDSLSLSTSSTPCESLTPSLEPSPRDSIQVAKEHTRPEIAILKHKADRSAHQSNREFGM